MGQHFTHDDEQTTEAGGEIYSAICNCKARDISDKKIIEAMIAELYGMSHLISESDTADNPTGRE